MTDRELLEQAAKAAGIYLEWDGPPTEWQPIFYQGKTYHSWNPLTDDGDALRLAVKLGINIQTAADFGDDDELSYGVECGLYGEKTPEWAEEKYGDDPYAATRRAIVRAAAEIGKSL